MLVRPRLVAFTVAFAATASLFVASPAQAVCFGESETSSGVDPVSPQCTAQPYDRKAEGRAAAQLNAQRLAGGSRDGVTVDGVSSVGALSGWTDALMTARWIAGENRHTTDPQPDPDIADHLGFHAGAASLVARVAVPAGEHDLTDAQIVAAADAALDAWWQDPADRAVWMDPAWNHVAVGVVYSGADENHMVVAAVFRDAAGSPAPQWRSYAHDGGWSPARTEYVPEFQDVEAGHLFERPIQRMLEQQVTSGCNDEGTHYCPDDPVTRGQMAVFLTRVLQLPAGDRVFDDVSPSHPFRHHIAALAGAEITFGCNPPDNTEFCPDDPVTRGQMAAFLDRGLGLASADRSFVDVPAGHVFERNIAALAGAGITFGCNPPHNTKFCPNDPVTRGQMAAFLARSGVLDLGWPG